MKWLVLCACLSVCLAEAPFTGYAPSGWKPQGAQLNLPTQYGAPVQEQAHASEIEITKENIQYAGQLGETTTLSNPRNAYLPPGDDFTTELPEEPSEDDVLRVQGLPKEAPSKFNQPTNQLNKGEIAPSNANYRQQQFRGNLRQAPQQKQFGPRPSEFAEFIPQQAPSRSNNNFQNRQPQQSFQSAAQYRPQPGALRQKPQSPAQLRQQTFAQQQQQQQPSVPAQYAPPTFTQYGPPPQQQPQEPETEHNSEEDHDQEPDYDEEAEPAIAVSNAQNGQYYILAADNTLQKVVFMTSQTEDDRRNKGFTAQLRYSPVEPIRDPIYAYNEQGQLVRIYNKKK